MCGELGSLIRWLAVKMKHRERVQSCLVDDRSAVLQVRFRGKWCKTGGTQIGGC